jgi:hypothetical protein
VSIWYQYCFRLTGVLIIRVEQYPNMLGARRSLQLSDMTLLICEFVVVIALRLKG